MKLSIVGYGKMGRMVEQFAPEYGFTLHACIDINEDIATAKGADVAIEAVGLPEVWQLALQLLRRGGTINFFGGCPEGTQVPVDTSRLHYSELTLKASFHHTPALILKALNAVSQGYVTAKDFVNRVEPLTNLLDVMQHLMSHNGHMKTAIIP